MKQESFKAGLFWNYISIIILALSGILFNVLIICFYNAEALGIFNRVYAYYIVISQLCVCGIHMSIVRSTSLIEDNEEQKKNLSSAFVLVLSISFLVCLLVKCLLIIFGVSDLIIAFSYVLPALILFAINKVILGFFNGLSCMIVYAVLQSLRSISIAGGILFLSLKQVHYTEISKCFFIGESVVTIIGIILLVRHRMLTVKISPNLMKKHFGFGIKILLSNLVLELNTKVDVICLGWILKDDYQIGIYSFAVLFAEGFYQIFVVVRRSINPQIARGYQDLATKKGNIEELSGRVAKYVNIRRWLAVLLLIIGYAEVCLVLNKKEYLNGIVPLAIICFFIAWTAKAIIMGDFFAQIGKPEKESFINTCTVLSNLAGNIVFIYYMGIQGAAMATGISYVVFAFLLSYMMKRSENIQV